MAKILFASKNLDDQAGLKLLNCVFQGCATNYQVSSASHRLVWFVIFMMSAKAFGAAKLYFMLQKYVKLLIPLIILLLDSITCVLSSGYWWYEHLKDENLWIKKVAAPAMVIKEINLNSCTILKRLNFNLKHMKNLSLSLSLYIYIYIYIYIYMCVCVCVFGLAYLFNGISIPHGLFNTEIWFIYEYLIVIITIFSTFHYNHLNGPCL